MKRYFHGYIDKSMEIMYNILITVDKLAHD